MVHANASLPPSPSGVGRPTGPFADATHGWHSSIRFVGFDPAAPHSEVARRLAAYDFQPIEPIGATTHATLVIADTAGLHLRGRAPGHTRVQAALNLNQKGAADQNLVPRLTLLELAARLQLR